MLINVACKVAHGWLEKIEYINYNLDVDTHSSSFVESCGHLNILTSHLGSVSSSTEEDAKDLLVNHSELM